MEEEKHLSPDTVSAQSKSNKPCSVSELSVRKPLLKRPLDVILSAFMLILSLPVSLPIVLAIRMEDGGPVFYRQERWGRDGTRFRVYKFRTMVANSDQEFGLKQAQEINAKG